MILRYVIKIDIGGYSTAKTISDSGDEGGGEERRKKQRISFVSIFICCSHACPPADESSR